ncbi:hypothetical protein SAMN00790413_03377 [Deinococcus hopiensis KR-140]|uniref:Uncharacterized protein n=1 Tax=Deinococcus hopiensis KR-140 TaxID=695939 RepID=A0A1W1UWH0_9DEIO|nr:hypothetical protein SAMN00790413_03377 [Deinococcus hopiensis KR-140]
MRPQGVLFHPDVGLLHEERMDCHHFYGDSAMWPSWI